MLCNKKKAIHDAVGDETETTHLSVVDEIIRNEDLAFLISSYLDPIDQSPSQLCIVSKSWHQSFRLVSAQIRYDSILEHIQQFDDDDWIYHKIIYIPGVTDEKVPREGILKIHRSNCIKACDEACREFKRNLLDDEDPGVDRSDSRPDYYYRCHQEEAETIEFILPQPLVYDSTINFDNAIEYDEKPRLINRFTCSLGDVNGAQNPLAKDKSKEGVWNLGYHEIIRVQDMITSSCSTRPPYGGHGEDSTSWLRACQARPSDHPRWIKFAHTVGEDHCRLFLKKHLLPILGSRPTGSGGTNLDKGSGCGASFETSECQDSQ